MQRITSESEVADVMKQLGVGPGEELRESGKRQEALEKFAQLRSRNPNTTLQIANAPTAFVTIEEGDIEEFRNITITSREFEQQVTSLPRDYFDYIIQRGMTVHEVGHILYSSWPELKKYMEYVRNEEEHDTEQYVEMFKHFYNVLEDGAIEEFLRQDFRVEEELLVLRATLHEGHYMGKEYTVGDDVEYHYPFFFAVITAALNIGIYDNGETDKLLDENNDQHFFAKRGGEYDKEMFVQDVLPRLRSDIPDIQQTADSSERMQKCYELWDFIRDYIDNSTTPGKSEFQQEMKNQESDSYAPGVPENVSEAHGHQEGDPIVVVTEGSEEDEDEEDVSPGEERGQKADELNEDSGGQNDVEQKAQEGIVAETKQQGSGDWSDEIEEIINALGAGDGVDEIAVADEGEVNRERQRRAERHGKRCERIFRTRLRQVQKDKIKRGKRRGRLDGRQMVPAERGSTRIFQQTERGDDKNYSCVIVVDRSGSMSGRVEDVELAAGSVAYGLEANGVDTCILDTHNSMTTLSKPFGTRTSDHEGKVFAGRIGGGTPLTHTMKFARQRISRGQGDIPFCIVITDGCPRRTENFKEEVRKANFPVMGLYLTNSGGSVEDQLNLYDKAVTVSSDDDVGQRLINLINGVVW